MNLEEMRKIAEAATQCEWRFLEHGSDDDHWGTFSIQDWKQDTELLITDADHVDGSCEGSLIIKDQDAKHIATFDPPTVLKMLDVIEKVKAYRAEALKEPIWYIWYTGMGCEFAKDVDEALAALEGE